MQKAAYAIMVKDSWLASNSSLEKTIALSGDKWAVSFSITKRKPQQRNSYYLEKIGCSDQRPLQWELNREPPDYSNQSHLKRVGITKGPLQLF